MKIFGRIAHHPHTKPGFIVVAIFFVMMSMQLYPRAFIFGFIGLILWMAYSTGLRLHLLWTPLRKRCLCFTVACARSARKSIGMSLEVQSLLLLTLLLGMLEMAWIIGAGKQIRIAYIGASLIWVLLWFVGTLDAIQIAVRLTKQAWARWMGKGAIAALSGAAIWISGIFAEHTLADAMRINPGFATNSKVLLQFIYTPFVGIGLIGIALSVFASLIFFGILFSVMFVQAWKSLRLAIPIPLFQQWMRARVSSQPQENKDWGSEACVIYRLMAGKNRRRGEKRAIFDWDEFLVVARAGAITTACVAAMAGSSGLLSHVEDILRRAIVPLVREVEFHKWHQCTGTASTSWVHYLSDEKIIVFDPSQPTGQQFSGSTCG